MRAADVMTPDPRSVLPDERLQVAAEVMRDLDVGFVPVVADRNGLVPIGVITDRDIAIRHVAAGHGADCSASAAMTGGDLVKVHPDDDVASVMRAMKDASVRRALVTGKDGRLLGVIATADLLRVSHSIGADGVESVLEAIARPTATHPA